MVVFDQNLWQRVRSRALNADLAIKSLLNRLMKIDELATFRFAAARPSLVREARESAAVLSVRFRRNASRSAQTLLNRRFSTLMKALARKLYANPRMLLATPYDWLKYRTDLDETALMN